MKSTTALILSLILVPIFLILWKTFLILNNIITYLFQHYRDMKRREEYDKKFRINLFGNE